LKVGLLATKLPNEVCVSAHSENFSVNSRFYFSILVTVPVKFFSEVVSNERGIFSPLVTFLCTRKKPQSEKTVMVSTTKKIQNPEWRTSARLCFFSLTGGLFRFFEIVISSIGYGD
jgi:hypothetical protein